MVYNIIKYSIVFLNIKQQNRINKYATSHDKIKQNIILIYYIKLYSKNVFYCGLLKPKCIYTFSKTKNVIHKYIRTIYTIAK